MLIADKNKLIGIALVLAVLPALALSYYFSFRAGCIFDSKQGFGDIHAAAAFARWELLATVSAIVMYSLGVYRLCFRNGNRTAGILLLSFVLGAPLLFWINFEGEVDGIQTCSPS